MAIKHIKVSNFKSFKELDVELGSLNILIGANASGKSNFIQVLKFLRDIACFGLDNAVSMQGSIGFLRSLQARKSEPVSVEVAWDHQYPLMLRPSVPGLSVAGRAYGACYGFAIEPTRREPGFRIASDQLTLAFDLVREEHRITGRRASIVTGGRSCQGTISVTNRNGELDVRVELPEEAPVRGWDLQAYLPLAPDTKLAPRKLLLGSFPDLFGPAPFAQIRIYDFDPRLPKKATPVTGKVDLEEDGSNVALALQAVLASRTKRRTLMNLLKDVLPFVEKFDVEHFADKSLMLRMTEAYFRKHPLPASFVSDGTISLTSLVLALFFQEQPVIVVEEPERNVHPHLISRLVAMMGDAARSKQVVVTTHNPGIVRHAGLNSILLVSRDNDGFSRISRPAEKMEVQTFLENEIGIDELFTQSVLESLA
jgi:predicted ATPase